MATHQHPHGLMHDLETLLRQAQGRRAALRWLGAGAAVLAGCGGGGSSAAPAAASSGAAAPATATAESASSAAPAAAPSTSGVAAGAGDAGTCSTIPNETAGPYPGDGTNGPNALAQSGILRSDIRPSFGGASGIAAGVPLTLRLQLVNAGSGCASLEGLAVYLWHCDALGRYSLYSAGVTGENYLRGLQQADGSGEVAFTTIVPGCYDGRWPHIHFEVYPSLASATHGSKDIKTSQLAIPADVAAAVYADARYAGSAANLSRVSLATDNVFSDGSSLQVAEVAGDPSAGFVATLRVGVQV